MSYIKSQKIPVIYAETTNNNQKWDVSLTNDFRQSIVLDFHEQKLQNFDILAGYDNEPIIAFHLSSTICADGSVSQNLDFETDNRDIEVLNGLCDQVWHFRRIILFMTQYGTNFSYFRELILFYMASTRFTSFHANIEYRQMIYPNGNSRYMMKALQVSPKAKKY